MAVAMHEIPQRNTGLRGHRRRRVTQIVPAQVPASRGLSGRAVPPVQRRGCQLLARVTTPDPQGVALGPGVVLHCTAAGVMRSIRRAPSTGRMLVDELARGRKMSAILRGRGSDSI
jgi:hypothetical protein